MNVVEIETKKVSDFLKLSDEIVVLMLNGLTASEIGEKLNIDIKIVTRVRHQILKKFGLNHSLQFLALALDIALQKNEELLAENIELRRKIAA